MSENINNVNYDTECSEDYRVSNMKKDIIVQRLKDKGPFRNYKAKTNALNIILEEDCSCVKIYYKASKKNKNIGFATVYRLINMLEEIGAISRKNL